MKPPAGDELFHAGDFFHKMSLNGENQQTEKTLQINVIYLASTRSVQYLRAPLRADGVAHHSGALFLAVVRQRGEDAVLAGLDGELQVRVGIKEHPLLQSHRLQV